MVLWDIADWMMTNKSFMISKEYTDLPFREVKRGGLIYCNFVLPF